MGMGIGMGTGIIIWLITVVLGYVFLYLIIKFAISEDMMQLTTEISAVRAQQDRLHKDMKVELMELNHLLTEQNEYLAKMVKQPDADS